MIFEKSDRRLGELTPSELPTETQKAKSQHSARKPPFPPDKDIVLWLNKNAPTNFDELIDISASDLALPLLDTSDFVSTAAIATERSTVSLRRTRTATWERGAALGVAMIVGSRMAGMAGNFAKNLHEGRIVLMMGVAEASA